VIDAGSGEVEVRYVLARLKDHAVGPVHGVSFVVAKVGDEAICYGVRNASVVEELLDDSELGVVMVDQ